MLVHQYVSLDFLPTQIYNTYIGHYVPKEVLTLDRYYYEVKLELRFPSEKAKEFDFSSRIHEIFEAVNAFNSYYADRTPPMEMKLIYVGRDMIHLYYSTHEQPSGRDLSVFSKRLYHEFNWRIYSRIATKLFKLTLGPEQITENEFESAIVCLPSSSPQQEIETITLTDDEAIQAFQALISTQTLGIQTSRDKKQKAIHKIKEILMTTI
jgi:hypothetical protein